MFRSRPAYLLEFRHKMIDLVRAGRNTEKLAKEFEPTAQTFRNWVALADGNACGRTDVLTSEKSSGS